MSASACCYAAGFRKILICGNIGQHITICIGSTMITSTANKQVKNIIQLTKKAKERQKQKVFLAEGIRIFEEIPKKYLQDVYVSESFYQKKEYFQKKEHFQQKECYQEKEHFQESEHLQKRIYVQKLKEMKYEIVSDAVFQRMSDTKTPQGILCVVRQPEYQLEDLLMGERTHLLILEGIQDPGNLGTMFRTGEGAGITGIIMNGCADIFAPKTVRSTMGSICRIPFYVARDLHETLRGLKEKAIPLYAAHLKGKEYYDAMDYRKAAAFLIGSEGNGLTEETAALADIYLKIPMGGQLESLNAAMAAGILMYEVNRQRRGT